MAARPIAARTGTARHPRHAGKPARRGATGRTPGGATDPVRLAVARAYVVFAGGGAFAAEPPPRLREEAQRRLYVQLLRGLVRHRRLLEAEVARLAGRPAERLDAAPLALAMLGLFQLRFLDVPPHAAVYETVALAPKLHVAHAKGWVNAILRAAQREGPREEAIAALPLAVRTSHPDWMVQRWTERYGARQAAAICTANDRYEGAAVRVEARRIAPEVLLQRLADEDVAAVRHPLLPDALWVEHVGALLRSRAFREGLCYVQDVSSQLLMGWVAPLLEGRALDVCAAPGGKLTHLLGLRREGPRPFGAELALERLAQVRENVVRLRLPPPPLLLADGRALPLADAALDAVLVDAPCSATGMIRKYPELKWRKHLEDLPRFTATQAALLAEAARVVRPGGHIVYATCSLEPEENEHAVAAFLAAHPAFRHVPFATLSPPRGLGAPPETLLDERGDLLLLPGPQRMGLYAAVLRRDWGAA